MSGIVPAPVHPVEQLATWELRDLRAKLERALEQADSDAKRQVITDLLNQVTTEQDERAGHPDPEASGGKCHDHR